jgi:hypothetical protein
LHALLSATYTVIVHVSVADSAPTVQEYVEVAEPDADPEQYAVPAVIAQVKE